MNYNEDYKEIVTNSMTNAISVLENTKATANGITNIPSDFERAGEISNIKEGINNIKLGDIYLEITSLTNGYANAEMQALERSSALAKGSELARYEEEKGKAKLKTSENKYIKGGELAEYERQKGFDALDRKLEEKKKYIHENYSNETQILLEELKAEAQYSHDGSMTGYIQAMNDGNVKKVEEVMDNLINKGKRTTRDKEIAIAQCIHNFLGDNDYEYHASDLIGLYPTFDESKNSKEYKRVCCATYVSWVLKELGYIKGTGGNCGKDEPTDSDFTGNQYSNMHSANDLNDALEKKEGVYFEKVKDISTIKPGDILYFYEDTEHGHIEIYAGNDDSGNWVVFNCGSNAWINYSFPTARDNLGKDRKTRKPTTVWRIIENQKTPEEDKK